MAYQVKDQLTIHLKSMPDIRDELNRIAEENDIHSAGALLVHLVQGKSNNQPTRPATTSAADERTFSAKIPAIHQSKLSDFRTYMADKYGCDDDRDILKEVIKHFFALDKGTLILAKIPPKYREAAQALVGQWHDEKLTAHEVSYGRLIVAGTQALSQPQKEAEKPKKPWWE